MKEDRYRIGDVYISRTTPTLAIRQIEDAVKAGLNTYICVSNIRTTAYANKHSDYREVMNNSYLNTPDGMPLVWLARLWGLKDVQRTTGPDIFMSMLLNRESGIKHFLLGDTGETLAAMKEKYSTSCIVGTYSPPFCELNEYNYEEIANVINESNADIVWVSLRAPKQDFFAVKLLPYLNHKICIGVGAAFRFSLGQIKHPSEFIRKLGLTGLFWRKINLSKIGWYFHHLILILGWGCKILILKVVGKKYNE